MIPTTGALDIVLRTVFDAAQQLEEKQVRALHEAVVFATNNAGLIESVGKDAEFALETCKLIFAAAQAGVDLEARIKERQKSVVSGGGHRAYGEVLQLLASLTPDERDTIVTDLIRINTKEREANS